MGRILATVPFCHMTYPLRLLEEIQFNRLVLANVVSQSSLMLKTMQQCCLKPFLTKWPNKSAQQISQLPGHHNVKLCHSFGGGNFTLLFSINTPYK